MYINKQQNNNFSKSANSLNNKLLLNEHYDGWRQGKTKHKQKQGQNAKPLQKQRKKMIAITTMNE